MRKLACFALPCCAAIWAAQTFSLGAVLLWTSLLCALAGALLSLLRPRLGRTARRGRLIAFGLAFGLFWSWGHGLFSLAPAKALDGAEGPVSAALTGYPLRRSYGFALPVALVTAQGDVPATLYVYDEDASETSLSSLRPGDFLSCTAVLRFPSTYQLSQGLRLVASARSAPVVTRGEAIPLRFWPLAAGRALKENLSRCFQGETAGFLTALLLGDKTALPPSLYTAMKRAGLAHVAAVSGLHISFLVGLLGLFFNRKLRLGAFFITLLLFLFAAMVGNSPSVLRAVWLHGALLWAPLLGREEDRPTSLSAALLILLLIDPSSAADPGLQLSFASTAGIFLFSGPLYARWTSRLQSKGKSLYLRLLFRLFKGVAASLSVTVGALFFTIPITAWTFGTVPLLSPLANLLTLWAVSLAFLSALFIALLVFLSPPLALFLSGVAALPARYVCAAARTISRLPFASVSASAPYLVLWLAMVYLLCFLFLVPFHRQGRLAPLFLCSLLCLAAALAFSAAELYTPGLVTQVLDVGQGQSVLFLTQGKSILVDCGGTGPEDPGDIAADAVQATGSSRLDLLILTHYHADHAGGVLQLMQRLEIGALLVPNVDPDGPLRSQILALAREKGIPVTFLLDDASFTLGSARLTVFAPLGTGGGNEEGLSLLASQGEFDVLLTGDMNAAVEGRLLKYGHLPRIELLVAGHHGAATSTSEALLTALRPRWAAISCGRDNVYGHPAPEALERLGAAGCHVYRTDHMGTITFSVRSEP